MTQFPKAAHGYNQPIRFEADVYDCEVSGRIPTDLSGAYVKVGPMWYFPQMYPDDGAVNGDGYITMFRFKNGIVDFKSRWVKTPRWENDRKVHRQLYGKYRNPFTDDPSIRAQTVAKPYLRTTGNTHTLAHAGRLFAVKEDAHPYLMDPKTLNTIGPWDFDGQYDSQTFSGIADNFAKMRSELVIADAMNLEAGDVARVILPFRTSGLHGLWIGDDEVDFQ